MLLEIALALGGIGTVSGWLFAWRSRGEALSARGDANASAERARIAEVRAGAAEQQTLDAESRAGVASMQYRAAVAELAAARQTLQMERLAKGDLLEKLAKLGAPVGDVLLDSTVERLYANRHRPGNGNSAGPGPSGDPPAVPGDPTKPPTGSDKG